MAKKRRQPPWRLPVSVERHIAASGADRAATLNAIADLATATSLFKLRALAATHAETMAEVAKVQAVTAEGIRILSAARATYAKVRAAYIETRAEANAMAMVPMAAATMRRN